MAKRAGSSVIEVQASHAALVSQPVAVADLIITAARAILTTETVSNSAAALIAR